jgi:hypothetical protein
VLSSSLSFDVVIIYWLMWKVCSDSITCLCNRIFLHILLVCLLAFCCFICCYSASLHLGFTAIFKWFNEWTEMYCCHFVRWHFLSVTNWYDIFIYCSWVSTRWQWSVDLYRNRKETSQKEKQYTKQYKNNTKTRNTQNRKQKYQRKYKHKRSIKKSKSSNWAVTNRSK